MIRHQGKNRFLCIAIFLLGLAWNNGGPLGAQAQKPITDPLQYEVSVALRLVNVYVTDKRGNPVSNLAMNDFVVTDNGQPVTLTDFERRVLQPERTDQKAEQSNKQAAENTLTSVQVVRHTSRKFIILFDFAYNNARGIFKAKRAALHFLDTDVSPKDEVALLSSSMIKGIVVHEYLTADHSKIRKALETVGQRDIVGRADEVEERYWQQAEEGLRNYTNSRGAALSGRYEQEIAETNIRRWESKQIAQTYFLRMTALADALRIVPGQKLFVFFSSGIPGSLLFGNQGGTPQGNTPGKGSLFETGDPVLRSLAEEMNRAFAASGCTFFVFDTRESAMKTSLFERDSQTLETGRRTAFSPTSSFEASSIYKSDRITGRDPLNQLAYRTGGQYFSNIDAYEKNFDEVQTITGTYYVLGYPITERWDGKYHEVKVEVKRKGCEIRAQAGYFNPKLFAEYTDLEKQLHLFDLALNERAFSRLPVNVPMIALTASADGISHLAVLARLPGEVTAKLAGKRIEFVAILFDEGGEISDVVREEADPATLRGNILDFTVGTTLKPGGYVCRLVIRDMDTGLSVVASTRATVAKPQITGLQMGTPLVLEERVGGSLLYASGKKAREPFPWVDIYPYDSTALSPVLSELSHHATAIVVIIPCAVSAGGQPDMRISASLVDSASGERSSISILSMTRVHKGSFEILTLELPATDIAPGTYYLHLYAQDRSSGLLGHAFTTLIMPSH